ncbi:hypothetical protein [Paenibacillus sp. HJGM_3]|uniref:hypothetical protein n=1 Tax=Paenibacillus sp. HJGM_3 TaxID=3379816 RepID=UPI00385B2ADE
MRPAAAGASAPRGGESPAPAGDARASGAAAPQRPAERLGGAAADWIPRLLRAVGVEHEHTVAKSLLHDGGEAKTRVVVAGTEILLPGGPLDAPESPAADNAAQKASAESLKSVLLQLSDADGVPPALKEQVQQALQHVTGQQLLLTPDRGAVMSHITLFVPFYNGAGQQTASIHIQSRKGKKGEIDAHNCRLLFDLRMQAIGDTLVDVQVYDRKVQLQVHNDHPFMLGLLDTYREEIEAALVQSGYSLVTLRCAPFPELQPQPLTGTGESEGAPSAAPRSAGAAAYHVKPYRGVDFRV